MSFLRDLIESVVPAAYAEEPEEEEVTQTESSDDDAEEAKDDDEEEDEDEDEDEDDEDDEDEEEADPLDTLREECTATEACKPFNHHFHECVERVTKEMEEEDYESKHYKEDCIEEFFHLQHCVNDCVAPRLFAKLK